MSDIDYLFFQNINSSFIFVVVIAQQIDLMHLIIIECDCCITCDCFALSIITNHFVAKIIFSTFAIFKCFCLSSVSRTRSHFCLICSNHLTCLIVNMVNGNHIFFWRFRFVLQPFKCSIKTIFSIIYLGLRSLRIV